jgi:hypothetical protein
MSEKCPKCGSCIDIDESMPCEYVCTGLLTCDHCGVSWVSWRKVELEAAKKRIEELERERDFEHEQRMQMIDAVMEAVRLPCSDAALISKAKCLEKENADLRDKLSIAGRGLHELKNKDKYTDYVGKVDPRFYNVTGEYREGFDQSVDDCRLIATRTLKEMA